MTLSTPRTGRGAPSRVPSVLRVDKPNNASSERVTGHPTPKPVPLLAESWELSDTAVTPSDAWTPPEGAGSADGASNGGGERSGGAVLLAGRGGASVEGAGSDGTSVPVTGASAPSPLVGEGWGGGEPWTPAVGPPSPE